MAHMVLIKDDLTAAGSVRVCVCVSVVVCVRCVCLITFYSDQSDINAHVYVHVGSECL